MTEIVKAPTAADFLAAVPSIVGYTANNSLMCIPFSGNRTAGAIRVDLPRALRTSDYRAVASAVISMLGRMRDVDGITPIIYTDSTFLAERGTPWLDFERLLVKRLRDAGYHLPDALCVAADGWASYFDPDYPREGRSLEQIDASTVGARARELRGGHAVQLTEYSTLPEPDLLVALDIERTLALLKSHDESECDQLLDRLEQVSDVDPVSWVETCVELDELPPEGAAWLLHLIQSPLYRDAMMLQFAFGREVGEVIMIENERYLDIQRARGGTMDDVVMAEIKAGRASLNDSTSSMLVGDWTTRPDVERTLAAIEALRHVCAHASEQLRPAPLCMLAWLSWALGRGSASGAFVDAALEISPDYGMAQVIHTLISSGRLPEWAFAASAAS